METADLVTYNEEIVNGKLHFLCSEFEHVSKPLRDYHLSKNVRETTAVGNVWRIVSEPFSTI